MKKNAGRRLRREQYFKDKRFDRHAKMRANERKMKEQSRNA